MRKEATNRTKYLAGGCVALGLLVGVVVARATPGTSGGSTKTSLAFAGALTDANGQSIPGTHTLAFTFHNGANTCTSTVQNVTAQAPSGAFQIEVPIDNCPTFFDGADVTVDITLDGNNQVVTGQPVDPVAYAHYADKAATAAHATQADQPSASCDAGSVLTTGDGGFSCVPLPSVTYPNCSAGQVLTSVSGSLSCVTPPSTGGVGSYVGATPTTTPGRIIHANADPGLASAAAYCNDTYPGAHMCTEIEIYNSIVTGKINSSTGTIAKAWVYFPNWQAPGGNLSSEPTAGLGDNCSGYTYQTADTHTTGTAFSWDKWAYNGNWVPKFFGGPIDGACHNTYPIACCK